MYTIEELESIVSEGSNAVDITDIVDQLLDTMRKNAQMKARIAELETFDSPVTLVEHAQMKARIEAAAAIPAKPQESASDFEAIIYNECRAEFCKALGMGGRMMDTKQQPEHPISQYNEYCNRLDVALDELPHYQEWLETEVIRLQARIEAAAGIAEIPFPDITRSGFPEAFTNGANSMRIEFRKALGL